MKTWTVSHSKEGWEVILGEANPLKMLLETAIFETDAKLGHYLCGEGLPDWMRKIPLTHHRFDDGEPKHTIPGLLSEAAVWLIRRLESDVWDAKESTHIPIPKELGHKLWPEMAWIDDED